MTPLLGPVPCQGCRRPVWYGYGLRDAARFVRRWRNANGRTHTCQVSRVDDELGPVRVCPGCHEEWPLDGEFYKFDRSTGYYRSRCRGCEAA